MSMLTANRRWNGFGLAILVMILAPGLTMAQANYQPTWASTVLQSNAGSSSAGSPSDALGDTPSTYFTLGNGGSITVGFGADFSTSGDGTADAFIDEYGNTDCYYICLVPANAATTQALQNAGLTQYGSLFQLSTKFCGPASIDIDADVPGYNPGELCFSGLMVEDDGNGSNGAEVIRIRVDFDCTPPPPPPPGSACVPEWASVVIAYQNGSNHTGTDPNDVLGDTSAYHNLGNGGWITVAFPEEFTTSGDGADDLYVNEYGNVDCYLICLVPADAATEQALQAAGFQMFGSNLYQIPQTFCGTASVDIDSFVPGFSEGQLRFDELMIEDDGSGGNGAEIKKIKAYFVCPPPPPPSGPCGPEFASVLVGSQNGANQTGTDPNDALGNDPNTYHNLGSGGWITLAFSTSFSTSGDGNPDLLIDEWGNTDCYYVCLAAADAATAAALQNSGLTQVGSFYQLPQKSCGPDSIDIDAILPGYSSLELFFSEVRIKDDDDGGNGAEISRVKAEYVCAPIVPVCAPGWLATVINFVPGMNNQAGDPNDILGNTPTTYLSMGSGGCIDVAFTNIFTTTGDSAHDLFVDEHNVVDCYFVGLKPADGPTAAALISAGLIPVGGFYELPATFCGDENIDIDGFVPGSVFGELKFLELRIKDDGTSGDGAEFYGVEATLVCDFAKIGDRMWIDVNCDGIQDANELGLPGVTVTLFDDNGTTVLQQTTTGASGEYCFYVAPGIYVIGFGFDPSNYYATTAGAGNDPALDSDIDAMGFTAPITAIGGQTNLDIDAGVCLICTGITAFVDNNLPACGLALDPVLTGTVPALGSEWNLLLDSQFPFALASVFLQAGPPSTATVPGFATSCLLHIDPYAPFAVLFNGFLDANGQWSLSVPLPPIPALIGYEATLQARVCEPTVPGPLPGFPDWFSTGVHIIIGCP